MCEMIRLNSSPYLLIEIEHHMNIDREEWDGEPYDEVSALLDTLDQSEQNNGTILLKEARRVLILIGFYREMPPEEISSTITSSGRKPYAFKMHGKAWTTDFVHDAWIFHSPDWQETPSL